MVPLLFIPKHSHYTIYANLTYHIYFDKNTGPGYNNLTFAFKLRTDVRYRKIGLCIFIINAVINILIP